MPLGRDPARTRGASRPPKVNGAMCRRYTLTQVGPRLVDERFELGEAALEPATLGRFNVCPTEDILVVTHKGAARGALGPRAVVVQGARARDRC